MGTATPLTARSCGPTMTPASAAANSPPPELDDIRIYSGALTADQIKVLYDKESEGSDLSSIIIPAGSTSSVKYVFAEDDEIMGESDENLKVSIDTVTNGNKSNSSTSVDITIKDNDIKPDVTIEGEGTLNTINEGYVADGTGKAGQRHEQR